MFQIWIQNRNQQFIKVGPPRNAVDGNLWLQVLGRHFGYEVRLRPVEPSVKPIIAARSEWPGEGK